MIPLTQASFMPRDLRPVHTKGRTASDKTLPALKISQNYKWFRCNSCSTAESPYDGEDQICIKDALEAYSAKAEYKNK